MKKLQSLATLSMVLLFALSCTKTEVEVPAVEVPAVVFTNMTTSKTDVFIEETVTITVEGSGYTEINLTANNSKVKITKVASTVFEISATEAATVKVYAELKNNTKNQTKSTTINFVEHGVKNFNTVEGIKVNTDTSDKVLKLLGEPDYKDNSTDGSRETWSYLSKGLQFLVVKTNLIVDVIYVKGHNYYLIDTSNDSKKYFTNYSGELGNGWKINNTDSTMDLVVTKLGTPSIKKTSTTSLTNRTYEYTNQKIFFNFYSDSEDDYNNKKIIHFTLY